MVYPAATSSMCPSSWKRVSLSAAMSMFYNINAISDSHSHLSKKPEIYSKPYFDKISRSTAEIKLLTVQENGWLLYWNSISDFDFDVCVVIGVSRYVFKIS